MVFFNYIADMPDIPRLLRHAAKGVDTITLADLVFPGFLFIVGVAIPFAFANRIAAQPSLGPPLQHILKRTGGLLFLGFVLDSGAAYSESDTGLEEPVWYLLFFGAVIVLWTVYPAALRDRRPALVKALRWGAALVLAILLAVFPVEGPGGHPTWLTGAWWGILGTIGWTYGFSSLLYVLLSRHFRRAVLPALVAALLACTAVYCATDAGWLGALRGPGPRLPPVFWSHSALVLAGVVTGRFFLETAAVRRRVVFLLLWAGFLILLGVLLRPLQGANKIDGTASYCLLSAGLNALGFLTVFVVLDVFHGRWPTALLPIGANALLAYILPDILGALMEITDLEDCFWPGLPGGGLPGMINAFVMMTAIGLLASLATRRHVVLRL